MSTYYFTKIYFLARGLTLPQSRDWKWNIMDCFNEGFPGGFPYYWHNAAVLEFLLFQVQSGTPCGFSRPDFDTPPHRKSRWDVGPWGFKGILHSSAIPRSL